jgi:hypothetical protein
MMAAGTRKLLEVLERRRKNTNNIYYVKWALSFREHVPNAREMREKRKKEMKKRQEARARKTRGTKRRAVRCRR